VQVLAQTFIFALE
jgi:hypothetical protein